MNPIIMSRPDLSLTKSGKMRGRVTDGHGKLCLSYVLVPIVRSRPFPKTMVPAGQLDYTICIATWSRRDFYLSYYRNCWLTSKFGTGTRLNSNTTFG